MRRRSIASKSCSSSGYSSFRYCSSVDTFSALLYWLILLARLRQSFDALSNLLHICRSKTKPQRTQIRILRVERRPRHKRHALLDRPLRELARILHLPARAREPRPEEQAALRLRELDRVA